MNVYACHFFYNWYIYSKYIYNFGLEFIYIKQKDERKRGADNTG